MENMSSRNVNDLNPRVKELCLKFIAECKSKGIDIIITSTYRSAQEQNALYAQGRTVAGKKVTNAKGGQSFHNFRLAFDVVPLIAGKAVWGDNKLWDRIGAIGKGVGLEWAGDWKNFKEMAHFQLTDGLTIKDFQEGKVLA